VAPLKALVFDLDDTLYPEAAFVRSGFRAVARHLEAEAGLDPEPVFQRLWRAHLRGERGRLFDGLLAEHPGIQGGPGRLVEVYRAHAPAIRLFPGMDGLLDEARRRGLPLALISDGWLEAQRRKVEALGLASRFQAILLTDAWGRPFWKPHPRAFEEAARLLGAAPGSLVYVANNPAKDFQAPRALGWHTVRLEMPGQLPAEPVLQEADRRVQGVAALRALLLPH